MMGTRQRDQSELGWGEKRHYNETWMRRIDGAPTIENRMRGGIQPLRQATLLEATLVVIKAGFFVSLDDIHPVRSVAYWVMGTTWQLWPAILVRLTSWPSC